MPRAKTICIAGTNILRAVIILGCTSGEAFSQTPAIAQAGRAVGPEIVVSGTAEASAAAAKATFEVEIKTLAATAAAASAESARLSRAVMDALNTATVRAEEITGTHLSVGANWNYDESSRRQKRTAYQAINSIQMQSVQLDKVAGYIDAALSAGATGVTTVVYSAKDPDSMRRQALTDAIAAARLDAEAMVQAGGGRLGELLLLTTEQPESVFAERMDRMFKKSVPDESTELVAPKITVSARVIARWRFVANASAK